MITEAGHKMNHTNINRPSPFIANTAKRGFTLIELLTVIAIIGILAAILIPVVSSVRDSARQAQNISNLREIGSALTLLSDENGAFPYGWDFGPGEGWGTHVAMLISGRPAVSGGNALQHPILLSPVQYQGSLPTYHETVTNYSANINVMPPDYMPRVRLEQIREPSSTILVADALPREGASGEDFGHTHALTWWLNGVNVDGNPGQAIDWPDFVRAVEPGGTGHPAFRNNGRAHFLFADGHVGALRPAEVSYGHYSINFAGGVETPAGGAPGRPGR